MAVYRRIDPEKLKAWGEKWQLAPNEILRDGCGYRGYWTRSKGPDGNYLQSVTGDLIKEFRNWPSPDAWTELKELDK
jgi:hypothetical protein